MPDIGTLRAIVTADSTEFQSGMENAEQSVQRFNQSLENSTSGLERFERATRVGTIVAYARGLISAAAAAGGLVAAYRTLIGFQARFNTLLISATGGALIASFAGIALVLNRLVAAQSEYNAALIRGAGIANTTVQEYEALTRTFESLGASGDVAADVLNDVSERLEDAIEGNEVYARAFERLNLNIDELARQDRVSRLFALSTALAQVNQDAAQLSANELAGDRGQELLAVTRQFSDVLPGLYQEFSDRNRTTEQATENLSRWRIEAQLARTNASELFSRIGDISLSFDEFSRNALRAVGANRLFIGGLEDLGGALDNELERFVTATPYRTIEIPLDLDTTRLNQALRSEIQRVAQEEEEAAEARQRFEEEVLDIRQQAQNRINEQRLAGIAAARALEEEIISIREQALNRANEQVLERIRRERELAEQVALDFFAGADSPGLSEVAASRLAAQEAAEAENQLQSQRIAQTQLWGEVIDDTLTGAIHGTLEWQDVLLSALTRLLELGFGNLAGGLGFFGGARQFGGPVSANVPYLVGERGPELFVPSTSGNVVADPGSAIRFNVQVGDARGIPQLRAFFRNEAIPMLDEYLRDRNS